jgi:hypothetical protein
VDKTTDFIIGHCLSTEHEDDPHKRAAIATVNATNFLLASGCVQIQFVSAELNPLGLKVTLRGLMPWSSDDATRQAD